jgi:hypothetical protein
MDRIFRLALVDRARGPRVRQLVASSRYRPSSIERQRSLLRDAAVGYAVESGVLLENARLSFLFEGFVIAYAC